MDQGQEKTTDVVQQPIVKSVEEKIKTPHMRRIFQSGVQCGNRTHAYRSHNPAC